MDDFWLRRTWAVDWTESGFDELSQSREDEPKSLGNLPVCRQPCWKLQDELQTPPDRVSAETQGFGPPLCVGFQKRS